MELVPSKTVKDFFAGQDQIKLRENLPNSQNFRGPTQSGRSQGCQQKIIRFVKNQLHILMQSQTRKNCPHWSKHIDYTVANSNGFAHGDLEKPAMSTNSERFD